MDELLPSIRHNLARLLRFEGRDTNRQFWPWAILIFIVQTVAGFLIVIPMMANIMTRAIQIGAFDPKQGQPDPEIVAAQMESMMQESFADFDGLWLPLFIFQLVAILLLAAAVVRRLHDRDRSGWWGFIPLPFIVIGIFNMPLASDFMAGRPLTPLQSISLALSYGYWIALVVLVLLLVGKGDEGPNRFGPSPTAGT